MHFRPPFLTFLVEIFYGQQRKAIEQGTEANATQASLLG